MSPYMKLLLFLLITLGLFECVVDNAYAARNFSITMTNYPVDVTMGDLTTSVTYTVNNTTTGSTNSINRMTFVAPFGVWSATQPGLGGWTIRSGGGTATIQIQAGTTIPVNGTRTFTLVLNNMPSQAADNLNGRLTSVSARFSNGSTITKNTPAQTFPRLHALLMTLVPSVTNVMTGGTFTLTMTVTNKSTVAQNAVTSSPKPPTPNYSGGAGVNTLSNPPNISLIAGGGIGTLTWIYTATATGSVTFSAFASNGAATSKQITSSSVTIGQFIANFLPITPGCLFSGDIATFKMAVSNTTGVTLANVDPPTGLLVRNGAANIGTFTVITGPTGNLATGLTRTFVWTAPITANPADAVGQDLSVTGNATSTTIGFSATNSATTSSQYVAGYDIAQISPSQTNTNSTDLELVWNITNSACNNINQVSITIPVGWPAPSDIYSTVTNSSSGSQVDSWTTAGTTFTADVPANRIPLGENGLFYMMFPSTPITAQTYTFTTIITDTAGVSKTYNYSNETVDVNPYNTGTPNPNASSTGVWREDIQ